MTAPGASRFGIGRRLGTAFALSALFAVVACLVGWLSYERISLSFREIGENDLPAATASARIAQAAGAVTAAAPLLSQAGTREQVDQIAGRLAAHLREMRALLAVPATRRAANVPALIDTLEGNLDEIRRATLQTILDQARNDEVLREVRALHSDLVEEAEPLIDDARFLVQTLLEAIENRRDGQGGNASEIRRQIRKAEAILQASAHANLAVGLLTRIASVNSIEQLQLDDHFLAETLDLIRGQIPEMDDAQDTLTLRQVLQRLIEIAVAPGGLPALRRQELGRQNEITRLLSNNRTLVRELDQRVAQIVDQASERAAASGAAASRSIQIGRNLMIFIALAAIVAALVVGFAYVRGSLITRIRSLADAARALAAGHVPPPIEVRGTDELADMARAMEGFRQTQNGLVQSAKLAALGHLSAGIAHELNQPLNAIRAQAHNAVQYHAQGDAAGLMRALNKVQTLTDRAGRVVSHLRRFARRSDVNLVPVSVATVVEGAALILAGRIKETSIDLITRIASDAHVEADEIRLEQVLVNLIGNAIDAVAGRVAPQVTISAERSNNLVRIEVADNGPGLASGLAETLFDPFVSTKAEGEGLGLGLTISYNIIRDFGGALTVQSSASGAVFTIALRASGEG